MVFKFNSLIKYKILLKYFNVNIWISSCIVIFFMGFICSYVLLQQNNKIYDEHLYTKANACLNSIKNNIYNFENLSNLQEVIDRTIQQECNNNNHIKTRFYLLNLYMGGYNRDFKKGIKTFKFDNKIKANFSYTEINNQGYRIIEITENLKNQRNISFDNAPIRIEAAEDYIKRSMSASYILIVVWFPLLIILLLIFSIIYYLKYQHRNNINLLDNYIQLNIDFTHSNILQIPPNILEIKPVINTIFALKEEADNIFNKQKTFIADASHQLRTPLTIIISKIRELKKEYSKDNVLALEESVNRLYYLTKQFLSIARLETKETITQKILWHENIREIAINWVDIASSYNIDYGLEDDNLNFDNVYVNANIFTLKEAFNNLIDNAIKYSKNQDNPIVNIKLGFTSGTVWAKIIDNGIGIKEKDYNNLFNRFFRADNEKIEGSGLGLAIANEIIKSHNGFIRLLEEKETTFLVVLPRAK